ncbi:MAG: type II secretion system F family protein [Candidatus Hodarchaeaceae archaeon]|nr:type II secretion system F family protein [Candidatus Hodarchaeaceae archaeon]
MPKKKARKRASLKGFFTAVGGVVVKIGAAAKRLGAAVKISKPPAEKADEVARRLREIKRLELMREEELKEERKLLEEKTWEERAELKRPLSERLSSVFYVPLKRPAVRLAKSFKGMDEDLYKANLRVTPERYAAMMLGVSVVIAVFAMIMMLLLRLPLLFVPLGGVLMFGLSFILIRTQPRRRAKARVGEINRLIPYALRHMATQLSSGIGLPETMTSVSQADYGAMSDEFGRVIRDMHAGMSMEEALTAMDRRVDSEPLRRATRQIQRTLRTGGDLSRTLNALADETAFEMRMKLRDYTQSLNLLTMIYMFASAVIPALLMVVIMISSSRAGGGITPQTAGVLYLVLLPFLLIYFVITIKRFEPRL